MFMSKRDRRKVRIRKLRFLGDVSGTAVLEMTIMTPVLLVIGLGVIEFGNLMFKRHLIENGMRDAARYLAGLAACDTASKQAAANIASRGTIDTSAAFRVAGWELDPVADISCVDVDDTYTSTTYGTHTLRGGGIDNQLTIVKVSTVVTYDDIDLGFLAVLDNLGLGFSSMTFPVFHEERWYGNR